jgi:hypothetical protein
MSNLLKKGLLLGLAAAFVLCGTVNVLAGEVTNSKDKVSVSLYGQINRAVAVVDDGKESYLTHVDNDNSSTRFGFKAKAKVDSLTIGGNFEWEYQQNASNNMDHNSGTVNGALVGTWANNYKFYDTAADAHSTTDPGNVMTNYDGNSRKDRLRYDSPKFSGLQISASTFEEDITDNAAGAVSPTHKSAYDIALKYAGKFGDNMKLAAAVAYSDYPSDDSANSKDKLVNGSVSVLFSGISVTAAAGQMDYQTVAVGDPDSGKFYYGKLGYMAKFTEAGTTAFAVDYGKYDEVSLVKDDEASTYALYAVQNLDAYSTELYAGYRLYKLEDRAATGEKFDDIGALFLGARIKF